MAVTSFTVQCTCTGAPEFDARDSVTVRVTVFVPLLPSVTVTLLMLTTGSSVSAGTDASTGAEPFWLAHVEEGGVAGVHAHVAGAVEVAGLRVAGPAVLVAPGRVLLGDQADLAERLAVAGGGAAGRAPGVPVWSAPCAFDTW